MQRELKTLGALYVVATPIGNLKDITLRALEVLRDVDFILAEDTRHSQKLLTHYQITTPLHALHEHNEKSKCAWVLKQLQAGKRCALISDAGTPLISDPGFYLVRFLREAEVSVVPVPGACALISALSASGLPMDTFVFEGFLPAKEEQRCSLLKKLKTEKRTLVFYESCHRILKTLLDMKNIFGEERQAVLARELTKTYESILSGNLFELHNTLVKNLESQKGEFVILTAGDSLQEGPAFSVEAQNICKALLEVLPLKQAVALTASLTHHSKNLLYDFAVKSKRNTE